MTDMTSNGVDKGGVGERREAHTAVMAAGEAMFIHWPCFPMTDVSGDAEADSGVKRDGMLGNVSCVISLIKSWYDPPISLSALVSRSMT